MRKKKEKKMKNIYLQKTGLTTIGYQFRYNKAIKIERYKTSQTENKGCDQNR